MSKVPPGRRCESDESSAGGLGDGAGAGEPSNSPDGAGIGEASTDSADGIPSECDDSVVGTGLLKKEGRPLILSRIDSNLRIGIEDKVFAGRR